MKASPFLSFLLASLVSLAVTARAQIVTESATYSPTLDIPDGSTLGVADTRTIASQIVAIDEVRVSVSITGRPTAADAFNGDLYATLTHDSGFAVLLNRPGRTASDAFGYDDSGFNVTFDDTPSGNPDIHHYQLTLNPNGGALTGLWGSDGRNIAPAMSLDTTPRTAFLTSFNGLDPDGSWTLFVADVSPLGTARFDSWTLELTGAIPEPGSAALLLAGGFAMLVRRRAAFAVSMSRRAPR